MRKETRITPHYFPLTQQKFCCFPCCIQWILLRRGLKLISQDEMAKALDVIIGPEHQRLFTTKLKTTKKLPAGKTGYGTWDFTAPKFLKRFNLPLSVKRFYPSKIDDVKKFLQENIKQGNDIIVSFNMAAYANPTSGVNYVHSCVIDSVIEKDGTTMIRLGDPSYNNKKFFNIKLPTLLKGMSKLYGTEHSFKVFYNKQK
ncbi:MAG: hypothetical protein V1763_03040 [Parcubacteria group bacterium]